MNDSTSRSGSRHGSRHSNRDRGVSFLGVPARGKSIQCQFCPGQGFRRSTLRAEDLKELLRMRYPVRCLRCSQRQTVSFTVAGISVPSHVKQRLAKHLVMQHKHWSEPAPAEQPIARESHTPEPG